MDYGALIGRAWQLTWRHRFLWVLGLFATSTVGSCSAIGPGNGVQPSANSIDVERFFSPDLVRAFQQADPWLSRNIGWIFLSLILLALLAFLAFIVVSLIAQGGMAEATSDLAQGRPASARFAWNRGLRLFWRYLLLWTVLIGLGLLVMLVVVVVIGVVAALGLAPQGAPRSLVVVLGGLLALIAAVAIVPLLVASSIVVAFAQRAIAVEHEGAWQSLGTGVQLVSRNLGTSALAWLLSLALGLGAGIVVLLAALVLLLPLGALGGTIFYATGSVVSTALVAYGIVAAVAVLAGLWVIGGVANAFFWNYWTLIYLRFTGRLTERLEPTDTF